MKIIYIHQYFKSLQEGGGHRSYYMAKKLVDHGFEVELITGYNGKEKKIVNIDGIKVHYLPIYYDNKLNFWKRISAFVSFFYQAYQEAKKIKNASLAYVMSTPLTTGITALLLKKFHKIPYYFEVGDLWPEAPIQMGVIRNYFLKKILYQLEKKIYQEAEKIIALSPGMQAGVLKVVPQKQTHVIPNMADCEFFKFENKNKAWEKKYNVENNFVISYIGTVGKANEVEYFLAIIKYCKDNKINNLKFLLMGYGSELERIKSIAQKENLIHLQFIEYGSKDEVKEVLNVSDATYISFAQKPVLETNSPNKFFDGLAAGRLCIVNTKGWLKELVEKYQCGFYANPLDPQSFFQSLLPFLENKNRLTTFQENARKLAEKEFSRERLTTYFLTLFK